MIKRKKMYLVFHEKFMIDWIMIYAVSAIFQRRLFMKNLNYSSTCYCKYLKLMIICFVMMSYEKDQPRPNPMA